MAIGMSNHIIRQVGGASLLSFGFGLAVLLVGVPLAASLWLAHAGIAWAVRAGGHAGAAADALVSIVSVAAGLLLTASLARVVFQVVRRGVAPRRERHDRRREPGTRSPVSYPRSRSTRRDGADDLRERPLPIRLSGRRAHAR